MRSVSGASSAAGLWELKVTKARGGGFSKGLRASNQCFALRQSPWHRL